MLLSLFLLHACREIKVKRFLSVNGDELNEIKLWIFYFQISILRDVFLSTRIPRKVKLGLGGILESS